MKISNAIYVLLVFFIASLFIIISGINVFSKVEVDGIRLQPSEWQPVKIAIGECRVSDAERFVRDICRPWREKGYTDRACLIIEGLGKYFEKVKAFRDLERKYIHLGRCLIVKKRFRKKTVNFYNAELDCKREQNRLPTFSELSYAVERGAVLVEVEFASNIGRPGTAKNLGQGLHWRRTNTEFELIDANFRCVEKFLFEGGSENNE